MYFLPRWWIRVHLVDPCVVGNKGLKEATPNTDVPCGKQLPEKPLMSWAESMLCPCHNQPSNPKTTREHYSDFMRLSLQKWVPKTCLESTLAFQSKEVSKACLTLTTNSQPKTWRVTLQSLLFCTSQSRCQKFVGSISKFINPYPTNSHQFLLPIWFKPLFLLLWSIRT